MYLLERFLAAYNRRTTMRRAIWGLLPITAIVLALLGGLPPRPWRLLAQTLPQVALLWHLHGAAIIVPLLLLVVQALDWALLWLLPIGACILIVRHWWKQRYGFEFEFVDESAEADLALRQESQRAPLAPEQPERLEQKEAQSLMNYATSGQVIRPSYWQPELAFNFDIGTGWDVGKKRKDRPNEDSVVALQGMCIYNGQLCPFGLFVVADGMGGHANGQDASYLAIQSVLASVLPGIVGSDAMSDELLVEILATSVQQANHTVYRRGLEVRSDMGTTITAALVVNTRAFVVNVGDSRTYLYRQCDGLLQITHDHSHVARLVAAGQIAHDDIYTHPERNQIYRALGSEQDLEVDWFTLSLQGEDCLLLCSDGLWEMVRDQEIERILQQNRAAPSLASKALVRAALKGGGLDNISAVVVRLAPT